VAQAAFAFEKPSVLEPLLRHVARDLGKPDELTVVVADGVDYG